MRTSGPAATSNASAPATCCTSHCVPGTPVRAATSTMLVDPPSRVRSLAKRITPGAAAAPGWMRPPGPALRLPTTWPGPARVWTGLMVNPLAAETSTVAPAATWIRAELLIAPPPKTASLPALTNVLLP